MVRALDRTSEFTKSSLSTDRTINKTFMRGGRAINVLNKADEIDDIARIVYELNPYNVIGIKRDIKQLYRYRQVLLDVGAGIYKMILIVY